MNDGLSSVSSAINHDSDDDVDVDALLSMSPPKRIANLTAINPIESVHPAVVDKVYSSHDSIQIDTDSESVLSHKSLDVKQSVLSSSLSSPVHIKDDQIQTKYKNDEDVSVLNLIESDTIQKTDHLISISASVTNGDDDDECLSVLKQAQTIPQVNGPISVEAKANNITFPNEVKFNTSNSRVYEDEIKMLRNECDELQKQLNKISSNKSLMEIEMLNMKNQIELYKSESVKHTDFVSSKAAMEKELFEAKEEILALQTTIAAYQATEDGIPTEAQSARELLRLAVRDRQDLQLARRQIDTLNSQIATLTTQLNPSYPDPSLMLHGLDTNEIDSIEPVRPKSVSGALPPSTSTFFASKFPGRPLSPSSFKLKKRDSSIGHSTSLATPKTEGDLAVTAFGRLEGVKTMEYNHFLPKNSSVVTADLEGSHSATMLLGSLVSTTARRMSPQNLNKNAQHLKLSNLLIPKNSSNESSGNNNNESQKNDTITSALNAQRSALHQAARTEDLLREKIEENQLLMNKIRNLEKLQRKQRGTEIVSSGNGVDETKSNKNSSNRSSSSSTVHINNDASKNTNFKTTSILGVTGAKTQVPDLFSKSRRPSTADTALLQRESHFSDCFIPIDEYLGDSFSTDGKNTSNLQQQQFQLRTGRSNSVQIVNKFTRSLRRSLVQLRESPTKQKMNSNLISGENKVNYRFEEENNGDILIHDSQKPETDIQETKHFEALVSRISSLEEVCQHWRNQVIKQSVYTENLKEVSLQASRLFEDFLVESSSKLKAPANLTKTIFELGVIAVSSATLPHPPKKISNGSLL